MRTKSKKDALVDASPNQTMVQGWYFYDEFYELSNKVAGNELDDVLCKSESRAKNE